MQAKIRKVLESQYSPYFYFAFALLCWGFGQSSIVVCGSAIYIVLILLFCNDIKNIFTPFIYISFFIEYIFTKSNWVAYGICIGLAIACFVYYMIKNILKNKENITLGRWFWGFICLIIAVLCGGLFANYKFLEKLIIISLIVFGYLLYFVSINFCSNTKLFLLRMFIIGAVAISIQLLVLYSKTGDFLSAVIYRQILYIGTQNINPTSIFLGLGMISALGLGNKHKFDYLFFLVGTYLALSICLTFCRTNIALSLLFYIVLSLWCFIKSENKIEFAIVVSIISLILFGFSKQLSILLGSVVDKFEVGANGRNNLWPWCIDQFKEHPLFGVGFLSDERVPGIISPVSIIMAHNSLLQFLTSMGIFGCVLGGVFYFLKYKILFTKPVKDNTFMIALIIFVALTGTTDQAATMDAFVFFLNVLTISSVENYCEHSNKEQKLFDTLNKILAKEEIGYHYIEQSTSGFTNVVFFVDERYVVKFSTTKKQVEKLEKEISFYRNSNLSFIPKYISSGKIDDTSYLIIERIKGETLFHVWHTLSENERKDVTKQIAKILNKFHEQPGSFLADKFIQTAWQEKWQKSFDLNIRILEKYHFDTSNLKNFAEYNIPKLFEKTKNGLVYNDAHFDNFIYNEGKIFLIDFDRVLYCSIDYELLILKQMLDNPIKFASLEDEPYVNLEDYSQIYADIKKLCPDMFDFENIDDRIFVYQFVYNLGQAYEYNRRDWIKNELEKFNKRFYPQNKLEKQNKN